LKILLYASGGIGRRFCPVCGQKGTEWSLNIHHCIAQSKGGKNTKENCVAWVNNDITSSQLAKALGDH